MGAKDSTNNWAVLVCTSRFWFNYRVRTAYGFAIDDKLTSVTKHMANTLAMYRTVKRLGIPDSNIILMLADDAACNPRNPFAGKVFSNRDRKVDLYGETIEVDYKGNEVSVETFLRVLSGRLPGSTPTSKRLLSDERSNVFIYMTGHGGDEFLKFQDEEEIGAVDLADAFASMHAKGRYNEILFMIDTCQANTMYERIRSPGIIAAGSSKKGQNSYSHHADPDLGIAVTDRYTHHVLTVLESINKTSTATLQDLFDTFSFEAIHSDAGVRTDLYPRSTSDTLLIDFFGGVSHVETFDSPSSTSSRGRLRASPAKSRTEVDRRQPLPVTQDRNAARTVSIQPQLSLETIVIALVALQMMLFIVHRRTPKMK